VVDYPPEEALEFSTQLKVANIDTIFLLSPTTTDDRIAAISQQASGFLYYVSLRGTTGAGHLDVASVAARIPKIRRHTNLPIGVGFGIRDATSARAIAQIADAVVLGSRIIEEIESAGSERAAQAVERLVGAMRTAVDNSSTEKAA
jgi:tryptophan synthase alpha chain